MLEVTLHHPKRESVTFIRDINGLAVIVETVMYYRNSNYLLECKGPNNLSCSIRFNQLMVVADV